MTVCRRCRVVHSRLRRESMPEIISVYSSYVGRGGGDVLTSSVNELYLSGGFIRGFFLPLPLPPSPPPLLPSPPVSLHAASFVPLLAPPLVAPQLVLVPRRPFLLMILASLCDRQEFEIHEIRTFQIGAFNLLGPQNYS